MGYIVNIRGTNGSGKSTIPLSMMDDPFTYVVTKPYQGRDKIVCTVFPSYGWVALGSYHNKTGGLDGFPDTKFTKKAFWYVLKRFPEYHILLEGILASTVFSTYRDLFKSAEERYNDRKVIVLSLLPPINICLDRIQKRNGGKPIKEDLVANKWKIVQRNADKFFAEGFLSAVWDTSTCDKNEMLEQFNRYLEFLQEGEYEACYCYSKL